MPKGHLILAAVLLAVMLAVPAVAIPGTGTATDAPRPAADGAGAGQTVKVLRADTGTVETVTWHNYVFGVMAAESDPAQPDAALQAQAVAACTLALYRRAQRQTDPPAALQGADVTDDSGVDQGYITRPVARAKWGAKADAYERRLDELVAGVLGWVLTYEGQPAMAVYHAVSAGRTESAQNVWGGAVPYLVPVESVGDLTSPGYLSEKTFTKAEFVQALAALDPAVNDPSAGDPVGAVHRSTGGTVLTITLFGRSFTGGQVRQALGLRSANFDVAVADDAVKLTVRGYGHLVGMSQYGAGTMAEQGSTWQEILAWYYPGCRLEKIKI